MIRKLILLGLFAQIKIHITREMMQEMILKYCPSMSLKATRSEISKPNTKQRLSNIAILPSKKAPRPK